MKKLLIFILLFGGYVHFYPDSPIGKAFHDQVANAWAAIESISGTNIEFNFRKGLNEMVNRLPEFNANERAYIDYISRTKEDVVAFYQRYCQDKNFNAQLQKENLARVCNYLSKQSALF